MCAVLMTSSRPKAGQPDALLFWDLLKLKEPLANLMGTARTDTRTLSSTGEVVGFANPDAVGSAAAWWGVVNDTSGGHCASWGKNGSYGLPPHVRHKWTRMRSTGEELACNANV